MPTYSGKAVFLFTALFVLLAGALRGGTPAAQGFQTDPEAQVTIRVTPVAERWDGRGFMPLRMRIENHADERRSWDFTYTVGLGYSGNTLTQRAKLMAEGRDVTETVVFLAGAGEVPSGQRATVSIGANGPKVGGFGAHILHGNNDQVISTATTAKLEGALFSATLGTAGTKTEITVVDPARWPADWRVWSPFQRVVFTDSELAALDGARRGALREWVAMGGMLDIYPTPNGRETFHAGIHGHGLIRRMERSLEAEAAFSTKPAVMQYRPNMDSLPRLEASTISAERRVELRPARGTLGVAIFLTFFCLLIGPINLFVFAPANRRHRLFFTVPALSLGASALLAGFIVVKDGFGGEGARYGLVMLLPEQNQAVVTQMQVVRTGVLASAGFDLPDDVVLERLNAPNQSDYGYRRSRQQSENYERSAGRAEGDWFSSRRGQEHLLRRLTPTRARVELVGGGVGDAAPVVQSSVAAVLKNFRYCDDANRLWGAEEVPPGQRVTLVLQRRADVSDTPASGHFQARGGAAEGLTPIDTLSSIRWDESQFLYAGPLAGVRKP